MRPKFFEELHKQMLQNPDIFVLTGDLGYGGFDKIRNDYPNRFINCGASEQAMLDIAVGLALKGKVVFTYTITSFYLRAAETISLYLDHEQIPVHMVGSGRDQDYKHDGYSHDCTPAQNYIHSLKISEHYPQQVEDVADILAEVIRNEKPSFISLKR